MNTEEAIDYYNLNPQIAMRIAKKMGIGGEMSEDERIRFINTTLKKMQEKIARKMSRQFDIKMSKAMKAIEAMDIFNEESIDYDEFFERI